MHPRIEHLEEQAFSVFDGGLIIASTVGIVLSFVFHDPWADTILATLSFLGLIPVVISATRALIKLKLSVDLLAVIALVFSLISHEWFSAAFITLMLAFARLFDRITEARAKKIIIAKCR